MSLKERFMRFMYGRYGVDALNRFLTGVCIVLLVLSLFFGRKIFYTIGVLLLFYSYFRMFSKNHSKRYAENAKYLQLTARIRPVIQKYINKLKSLKQLKDYHIYKCPTCKQKLRVPRGRGKIAIRCRKCGTEFIKKS